MGSYVILNAVKNLSGCNKGCAIPEILRSAQDDRWGGAEVGSFGLHGFLWVLVSSCEFWWVLVSSCGSEETLKKKLPIRTIRTYQNPSPSEHIPTRTHQNPVDPIPHYSLLIKKKGLPEFGEPFAILSPCGDSRN